MTYNLLLIDVLDQRPPPGELVLIARSVTHTNINLSLPLQITFALLPINRFSGYYSFNSPLSPQTKHNTFFHH
ncbi:hypothetical protein RJT34_18151 [Clitoria ternatea]|uniref:Uncharacterized protein n=1 Tax=Clitoria ternatea TaxID=43366 RepID=A0AAN9JA90_CLITE